MTATREGCEATEAAPCHTRCPAPRVVPIAAFVSRLVMLVPQKSTRVAANHLFLLGFASMTFFFH